MNDENLLEDLEAHDAEDVKGAGAIERPQSVGTGTEVVNDAWDKATGATGRTYQSARRHASEVARIAKDGPDRPE